MKSACRGHRFPPKVISYAVWLYHRFTLSFRDVEDLLAECGITVSYEAIQNWCMNFGPTHARSLRRKQRRHGGNWGRSPILRFPIDLGHAIETEE